MKSLMEGFLFASFSPAHGLSLYIGCGNNRLTVMSMRNSEFILILLFINYCTIHLMNNYKPSFVHPIFRAYHLCLKYKSTSSGWCCSVDGAPACEPKSCQFNSWSGILPGLLARPPGGALLEATTHWCFSPSLSPSLPLSKKINK